MRFSQYCQLTCKTAVMVLAYSVILPQGWAQKGTKSKLPPSKAEVASVGSATAPPSEPDGLVPTPVTPRPATSEADASAEKPYSATGDQEYVIGPQDVLAINVWREPEISRSIPVRP